MAGHGANRPSPIARAERLDDGKMLAGFRGQAMIVVVRLGVVPGRVAKGPEQGLQPAELVDQKRVAAPARNQVVQPAVDCTRLRDEPRPVGQLDRDQPPQVVVQVVEFIQVDLTAGQADRLAFQGPPNLADLPNLPRRHPAYDGAPVGRHVQHAHAGQCHQGLADRRMAHAEPAGQGLRDQVLARADLTVDDLLEQRVDEYLPAQAVIP